MKHKKSSILTRSVIIALVIVFVIPCQAIAAMPESIEPKESNYLATYGAYTYAAGGGEVQVYFDVTGTTEMEDIGALSVEIHESTDNVNWTWVKSFSNKNHPDMLGHNDDFYGSHVTYQGVAGRYYKAYVCVWAGRNGGGDTRYFWTYSEQAT